MKPKSLQLGKLYGVVKRYKLSIASIIENIILSMLKYTEKSRTTEIITHNDNNIKRGSIIFSHFFKVHLVST